MINRIQIKSFTSSQFYTRGLDIYRGNKVTEFSVEDEGEGFDHIDAVAKGSGRNKYRVTLEYADYASRQKAITQFVQKKEKSLERLQEMEGIQSLISKNQLANKPKTTPAMKELLAKRQMKRGLPVLQEENYGKVRLEPRLICTRGGEISVEFKIGISRMYIMQDIFTFMRNLNNQAEWEYGAKLKFVHTLGMFDKESQSLIQFLQG